MRLRRVFFFQAEDGIRDDLVTGVQTCALPIFSCCILAVSATLALLVRLVSSKKAQFLREVHARATAVKTGPRIQVVAVANSAPVRTVSLLGEAHPYEEVTLYAKVSGYLRELRVDKGDLVEANQIVATIESP